MSSSSRSFSLRRLAVGLAALVMLCNPMGPKNTSGVLANHLEENSEFSPLAASLRGAHQAPRAFQPQMGAEMRFRRQVGIPEGSPFGTAQVPQSPPGGASNSGSNLLSFLSELGPQVNQAKAISSLFSSTSSDSQPQQASAASSAATAAALMGQLSDMIRASQERQARALQTSQQAAQSVGQTTASAAQSAQGGIQAALVDIGNGLQRIAANNPNLLPDVKSLYQSVSSKLSSASSSLTPAGGSSGQSQFAQGVVSQISNPQPLPVPST